MAVLAYAALWSRKTPIKDYKMYFMTARRSFNVTVPQLQQMLSVRLLLAALLSALLYVGGWMVLVAAAQGVGGVVEVSCVEWMLRHLFRTSFNKIFIFITESSATIVLFAALCTKCWLLQLPTVSKVWFFIRVMGSAGHAVTGECWVLSCNNELYSCLCECVCVCDILTFMFGLYPLCNFALWALPIMSY